MQRLRPPQVSFAHLRRMVCKRVDATSNPMGNQESKVQRKNIFLFRMISALLCLLLASTTVSAEAELETFLPKGQSSVVVKAEFLPDQSATLTLDELRARSESREWSPVLEDYANFGYQPHPYWYRFVISNPGNEDVSQILEIAYPLLDSVDFYRLRKGELIAKIHTGDRVPYSNRIVDHPHFLFPVQLRAGESNTIYLRVATAGSQLVPINLWEDVPLFIKLMKEDELHAIYFGIVLVIVFFNLLIFLALRERLYLYYSVSTFLFMLFFAIMRAKLYPYFFSDLPEFHHLLLLLLPPSCLLFATLFTREFLSIREYSPALSYLTNGIIAVALACIAGVFILDAQTSLKLSVLAAVPGTFLLLLMGPTLALMGNRIAWVYTVAWGTFMFGATVTAMSKHGFLPASFITEYGMQMGSALEVFILNAALAYRFYREHEDKITAQEARLRENADRREVELKLLDSSMSHPVTMMPNRSCFERQIQETLLHRGKTRIAICTIEISRYAEISKTLGHQNTDLMLCEVAQRYNEVVAKLPGIKVIYGPTFESYLCSLDNGAFGLLLDADLAESRSDEVDDILRELIQPIEFKEMQLELHPVVGVAVCPEHGLNASTLLRHAQVAADTNEARERYLSYYSPEQDQYNARRLMIISELKQAIRNDELELFLQPKLSLSSQEIIGVEALVRWHHHRYGLVRPDDFVPMAEQTGIIRQLTRWVFSQAMDKYQALVKAGHHLSISINISALNLREPDLIDFIKDQLRESGIEPAQIYLELTETSMMKNPRDAIATLEQLRQLGVRIAVDDFGAGYSSLAYLRDLPAHEIKIDKSLVAAVGSHESSEAVVHTAIRMCHELGFSVVAEGVENQELMNRLQDLDCDQIQGYLLTPPLPEDKIIEWLDRYKATQRFAS